MLEKTNFRTVINLYLIVLEVVYLKGKKMIYLRNQPSPYRIVRR